MRVAELRSFAAKFHQTVETTVKKQVPSRAREMVLMEGDN